jgi:hypothetical protein
MTAKQVLTQAMAGLRPAAALTHQSLTLLSLTTERKTKARYVLLDEAVGRGRLRVEEVGEGGAVPLLRTHNQGPWPVLGFDGEELVGAKQNRILNATVLLGVGERIIPVSCVEQGRWSRRSAAFTPGKWASHPELRRQKEAQVRSNLSRAEWGAREDLDQEVRAMSYRSDQGAVWAEVARGSASLRVDSDTGAMADAYAARETELEAITLAFSARGGERAARVPGQEAGESGAVPVEGMVAVAVFLEGRFVCLDALWPAERFAQLYAKLLRGYALESLYRPDLGAAAPADPEAEVLRLLQELSETKVDEQPGVDLGEDIRLEGRSVLASGLTFEKELLQLSVFPQ